jgi:hypothetical protein
VDCLNVHRIDLIALVNKVFDSLGFDLSLTLSSLVDSLFACFASFISTLSTHTDVNLKLVYHAIWLLDHSWEHFAAIVFHILLLVHTEFTYEFFVFLTTVFGRLVSSLGAQDFVWARTSRKTGWGSFLYLRNGHCFWFNFHVEFVVLLYYK